MRPDSNPDPSEMDLLALRDRLLDELEQADVQGVITAGIGRSGGKPALVLLVGPFFDGSSPKMFHGTPVIVQEMKPVSA